MSFLSGIVNFGKKALGFISGDSIVSSLARTALLGLAVNKISQSALKANDSASTPDNIDKGVRLQVTPDAEAKIPVLYGSTFFGGNITDAAMTNANKTMWYSLVLSEKTGTKYSNSSASNYTFKDVYWNQQRIVFKADGVTADYAVDRSGTIDRSISGLVKVYLYAGGSSAGAVPEGYTGTVPNADTLMPNWGASTHPMTDLIFAVVRVDYNREKNVTGIGNMLFHVDNDMRQPGDVLYDYFTSNVYGAGISAGEILTDDIEELNTYSLTSVNYTDEGTGPDTLTNRYQINGLIDTKNDVLQNAESIASAAASYLSYDTHQGKWGLVINKAESSSASFSDDNILGNISVGGTGIQDLYNKVKVAFPHRDLRDSADFVGIEIPSGDRNANEPDNTLNITYDIINEPVQAEVLGFIELKQSRVDKVIQFETDFSYINLKAGDVVDVTNERYGFVNKLFRIITITERQDTGGSLSMDITALEYDADVYSTFDITRFTRSDDDGIITIGSIGIPNTPQVTKYERDARPRILIESTSPTGVVEGLEFWLTTDYQEADDDLRSYTLIGTKRPVGGGTYASGTNVVFEYDNIGAENFYVKVRGINTTTTGPFSNESGLVEFVPEQVPNAITPDTSILDETGGLATALGIVSLLNNLDGLFGGDSETGLFDKIFDVFNTETGVDLVGQAAGGELVVAANIDVKEEGTTVASQIASLNFVGDNLTVTAAGTDVTVTSTGGTGTGAFPDGENNKDILAWNEEAGEWQLISGCISCDFPEPEPEPEPGEPGGDPIACILSIDTKLPPSSGTSSTGPCKSDSNIPYRGSYFIGFDITPGKVDGATVDDFSFYSPVNVEIGTVYLYGSDGKLEQALTESQIKVVDNYIELPFADRVPGKDYYIVVDEALFSYCGCESLAIEAGDWAFRTSLDDEPAYTPNPITLLQATPPDVSGHTWTYDFNIISRSPVSSGCINPDISLTFSEDVQAGTGVIQVIKQSTGTVVSTQNISAATINGATVTWDGVTGVEFGESYEVVVPDGIVTTNRQDIIVSEPVQAGCSTETVSSTIPAGPTLTSRGERFGFTTPAPFAFEYAEFCLDDITGNVDPTSNIVLNFNSAIELASSAPSYVYIYEQGGSIHQKINLNATLDDDGVYGVDSISGSTLTINPTRAFKPGQAYYMQVDADIIQGSCEQLWAGVSDTTTIAWQIDGIEKAPQTPPVYGSINIDIEFKRPVVQSKGRLNILDGDGNLITQLRADDPFVYFSDTPFD